MPTTRQDTFLPSGKCWTAARSAVTLLDDLIAEACRLGASDLHLSPGAGIFTVRMRIDGWLHEPQQLPYALSASVMARLKVVAGLRTDEHQLPQDGRFHHQLPDSTLIDARLSIIPTHLGENAVIRLLIPFGDTNDFHSLGLSEAHAAEMASLLERPNGMILLTGPTGSGKTTTLYAILRHLAQRPLSIITIEDPIEYSLPGIIQVPVRPQHGFDFARGLRSILRQDPDVIMVGEIRDGETARIASSAALTGHLVIATLHTTDASSALTRLKDLGVEPYLVASTVSAVIAQRLVRKLCEACATTEKHPAIAHARLLHALGSFGPVPKEYRRSSGCEICRHTGYAGRTGIYEFLTVSASLKEAVMQGMGSETLRTTALKCGMSALGHDGVLKARSGITSYEEVMRIAYA